nr:hypothetical protein [uncultured Methanoregula sp.]
MTDARRDLGEPEWRAEKFDVLYYRELLKKAREEIRYAFVLGEITTGGVTFGDFVR